MRVESKEKTPLAKKWSCHECGYLECVCVRTDEEWKEKFDIMFLEPQESRDVYQDG